MRNSRRSVVAWKIGATSRVAVILSAAIVSVAAEGSGTRSFVIPAHGTLALAVPAGWRDAIRQPPGELPPTIEFAPAAGDAFTVLITPIWKKDPAAEPHSL